MQALLHRSKLRLLLHLHDGLTPVEVEGGVLFDTVGTRVYSIKDARSALGGGGGLQPSSPSSFSTFTAESPPVRFVVCEVRARDDGTSVLTVRSPLRLRNATNTPMAVRLHASALSAAAGLRGDGENGFHEYCLSPGEMWAAPLGIYTDVRRGISIQPQGSLAPYNWSADESFKTLARGSCLLYTSPSPRDRTRTRMPSSA